MWCGPYKVLKVLNKGDNVKQDAPAPFHGLCDLNRHSIKPRIHRGGQLSRLNLLLHPVRFWMDVG